MDELLALLEALASDETRAEALAALDDDALAAHEGALLGYFTSIRSGEVEGVEPDDLTALAEVRDAVQAIRGEAGARFDAAAAAQAEADQRAAEAAAIEAELLAADEPEATDDEDDDDAGDEAAAEADEAAAIDPVDEPTTESVTAAAPAPRPTLANLANARRPAEAQPRPSAPARTTPAIMGLQGREFANLRDLSEEIIRVRENLMDVAPGFRDRFAVGRIRVDLPEERRLRFDDSPARNGMKLEALTRRASDPARWANLEPEAAAVVASGGWCAPLEPVYDYMTISDAGRPVRSGLPVVQADRGGVRITRGQGIADITEATAITVWDAATDTTPGESTKTCLTVACDTVTDVELQAIVRCLEFGNFQSRAFPEWVEGKVADTLAVHARVAERELLDGIEAGAGVLNVTQGQFWGAARDVLHAIEQAAAAIRNRQRMTQGVADAQLRLLAPAWLRNMMMADIISQTASGELDALNITGAQVDAMIRNRGVNVAWFWDNPTGGPNMGGPQADGVSLRNWPTTVEWALFPEGNFVFLDGGELNLGLVRDSTLNDTNDYQLFAETFEQVAALGPEALWVTQTLCPDGSSALPTVETPCAAS